MTKRNNVEGFSVTQLAYKDTKGKKHKSTRYHVRWKDHSGIWRRLPAFTDLSASTSFGRKIRQLDDLRAVGESPRRDLAKWVDGLSDEVRSKLIRWGTLDLKASMAAMPLNEHIETWHQSILDDGRTQNHADIVKVHTERIIKACKFVRFSDIDAELVKQYLAKKQRKKSGSGISIETRNSHLRAIKQFCRWMVDQRRASESPVAGLKMLNAQTDRRRTRRSLSVNDLLNLLEKTRKGPQRGKTTGGERALIYWVAVETGLRASEIRSLSAGSFNLLATPPTVTVEAAYSKRRRRDTLSLTPELATDLRTHLANKLPNAKAFTLPIRSADMLKDDLERADILYRDPNTDEVFDFHSLRVQCATNLARGGAFPAVAQARMRHSTIELTMNTYTRLGQDGQTEALAALPKLSDRA